MPDLLPFRRAFLRMTAAHLVGTVQHSSSLGCGCPAVYIFRPAGYMVISVWQRSKGWALTAPQQPAAPCHVTQAGAHVANQERLSQLPIFTQCNVQPLSTSR